MAHNFSGRRGGHSRRHAGFGDDEWDAMSKEEQQAGGANLRNVWTIATQPFPGAHFATFPEELAARCIAAGTSAGGVCEACGAPYQRVAERSFAAQPDVSAEARIREADAHKREPGRWGGSARGTTVSTLQGWRPACECAAGHGAGGPVVLDPFMGSGTVALVALKMGRRYIGIELNPQYVEMAEQRLRAEVPLFAGEVVA